MDQALIPISTILKFPALVLSFHSHETVSSSFFNLLLIVRHTSSLLPHLLFLFSVPSSLLLSHFSFIPFPFSRILCPTFHIHSPLSFIPCLFLSRSYHSLNPCPSFFTFFHFIYPYFLNYFPSFFIPSPFSYYFLSVLSQALSQPSLLYYVFLPPPLFMFLPSLSLVPLCLVKVTPCI